MDSILKKLSAIGLVPVIKLENIEDSEKLAGALQKGGVPVAEVTFRAAGADVVIRRMLEAYPDMLVGAGTVLSEEQAALAIKAGARYIVSPGTNPRVVAYCQERGVAVIPGVSTPTEIEKALGLGLSVLKFFPAEQSGGLTTLKALGGPYPNVQFVVTGGVNLSNLAAYMAYKGVAACAGTFMVSSFIKQGEWDQITALCRECIRTMLGFSIAHVGINAQSAALAADTASMLGSLLQLPVHEGNSSVFVDKAIEVMKKPYLGSNGHIAIRTANISRAVAYLEASGVRFRDETVEKDGKGALKSIYFEQEAAGFALHLVQ